MLIKSVLCQWREILSFFFQLLYAISTFRLFINENSCSRYANALYGVFVIMALKSWNWACPYNTATTAVNKAKFFLLICDRINMVPLYLKICKITKYTDCSALSTVEDHIKKEAEKKSLYNSVLHLLYDVSFTNRFDLISDSMETRWGFSRTSSVSRLNGSSYI